MSTHLLIKLISPIHTLRYLTILPLTSEIAFINLVSKLSLYPLKWSMIYYSWILCTTSFLMLVFTVFRAKTVNRNILVKHQGTFISVYTNIGEIFELVILIKHFSADVSDGSESFAVSKPCGGWLWLGSRQSRADVSDGSEGFAVPKPCGRIGREWRLCRVKAVRTSRQARRPRLRWALS